MCKVKKHISLMMIVLLLFSLSSNGIIVYANGVEDDVEDIISLEDIPDEEQIEPFGAICYEPIQITSIRSRHYR